MNIKQNWRRAMLLLVAVGVALAPAAIAKPASAHNSASNFAYGCQPITLKVTVPGDATTSNVAGKICADGSPLGKPLQFTVAGLSYKGDTYWDNPNPTYSYARAAAHAGFAVYVYDQIGSGGASANPAAGISLVDQMQVMHQLIGLFRGGNVSVQQNGKSKVYQPSKVIVVGHSLGAAEAMRLGGTYPGDANGFILQSYLHAANPAGVALVGQFRVTATQTVAYADPMWANYVTTADGHRDVFYYTPNADPAVINADEATKGVSPVKVAVQSNLERTAPVSGNITVPVLLVTGEFDILNCDAATAGLSCANSSAVDTRERQFYANSPCFIAYTAAGVGHDVNLHRTGYGVLKQPAQAFLVQQVWAAGVASNVLKRC